MSLTSRRTFTKEALGSLLTFSFVDLLVHSEALAADVQPIAEQWLTSVHELALDVKDQRIKQLAWQEKIEELFARVPMQDFLRLIDFDRLAKEVKLPESGARSLRPSFSEVAGIPTKLAFGRQIFALGKGRSVVPHGHSNMATAFLVLRGDLRGRHYDRVEDQAEHFVIKPTIDRHFTVGECSTISDFKDNVHWFQASSESAFIFNIHVMGVNPGAKEGTGRLYLDPNGEQLSGGLIRARRIDYAEAHRLYG
jgi:hypothetical protein